MKKVILCAELIMDLADLFAVKAGQYWMFIPHINLASKSHSQKYAWRAGVRIFYGGSWV
jgi:hypothetical protein